MREMLCVMRNREEMEVDGWTVKWDKMLTHRTVLSAIDTLVFNPFSRDRESPDAEEG